MATFVESIKTPSNTILSTSDGSVQLNTAFNKLQAFDENGSTIVDTDRTGLDTYDSDGNNMLHSGKDPSGSAGVTAIARQGEDALSNL